ncbi:MAG: DUF115 domain-containing protein [Treponema sp.]|nr:DUF115 domain-containing protein [Treponema sp.]
MNGGFSWNGKTLLSGIDPAGRANRAAEAVPVMDRTLYVCPSPLYGYGLECLLNRIACFPHSVLLCIEADPELFALSQKHFDTALQNNPQLRITNHCEAEALCTLLRQEWGPRTFRRVQMVRLNGGWQLFPALYDTVTEALRQEIALDWGNALTLTKLGRRYIRNAVRNLALVPRCPSIAQLSFGNDPVLVLGAGPALDAALIIMPLAEPRPFRIICVDTCLPALRERGITPDLAVILESQHWNLEDFTGLSGWNVPVAMDLSALPRSAGIFSGGLSLFFTPWTDLAIFDRLAAAGLLPAALPPLGSVGLSAVAIARLLSQGPIITAGLDFSFTLDSYYARSTPGHKARLRRQNRFTSLLNPETVFGRAALSAVSKTGGKVFSSPALRNYRDLFEREFAADTQLFAIADSGLPLGLKTLSPEESCNILSLDSTTNHTNHHEQRERDEGSCGSWLNNKQEALQEFIKGEQDRLRLLRSMLVGEAPMDYAALETLIGECDYLWAHFPDYAASDRRPSTSDISFLKRLRVEIDPFLKLWDMTNECMLD